MTIGGFFVLGVLSLVGCDKVMPADEAEEEVEEVDEDRPEQEEPEEAPEQAHGAPDPLKGKSLAEICGHDGLALVKFPYDKLHEDFAGVCCGEGGLDSDNERCNLDWPFNDVPSCDAYEVLREDMIAHFGFPFRDDDDIERYKDKDWYERREDYKPEWVPTMVKKNAQKIKKLQADKVNCE